MPSLISNAGFGMYFVAALEKSMKPPVIAIRRPSQFHAKRARESSEAVRRFDPMPTRRRSRVRFVPIQRDKPVQYSSKESGRAEVYVRPFDPSSPTGTPPGGGKWQVSTQGGVSPRWNSNGKELFYVAPDYT